MMNRNALTRRANLVEQWLSTDTLDKFSLITESGPNLYKLGDIEYKFNSRGFRCDEFDAASDLPVLFLGCSITEGVGLRQHETWSYLLLEKIREKTNKVIPYWNLGLAASGIDTQARLLHSLTTTLNGRIQFVFGLFPPLGRREYKMYDSCIKNWSPNCSPTHQPFEKHTNRVFSDKKFAEYQAERSLIIIDAICRWKSATLCCTSWDAQTVSDLTKLSAEFQSIDVFQPLVRIHSVDHARDGVHPGPASHRALADQYWEHVEHYF